MQCIFLIFMQSLRNPVLSSHESPRPVFKIERAFYMQKKSYFSGDNLNVAFFLHLKGKWNFVADA